MTALKEAAFFYDCLKHPPGPDFPPGQGPLVGYFCNVVPDEMIAVCGAVPARLCCLDAACARKGEQVMSAETCPMVKSICGSMESVSSAKPVLIVVPGTCDNKTQLYQHLKEYAPLYFLDLPRENDYLKNCAHWVEQFQLLYRHLKMALGAMPARDDLRQACLAANDRTAVFRRLEDLRATHPQLIKVADYFAMASASFYVLPDAWTGHAKLLLKEAEGRRPEYVPPQGRKKILLAGAPVIYPYFKILDVLDSAGLDVACDVLCSAHGKLADPVVIDEETEEGVIRALALKHVAASMCPCFLSFNKFAEHVLDRVKTLQIDGVVFHSLRLCQLFDVQAHLLRQSLKAANIPLLVIKSDLGEEDIGQIRTRVEAFREMLE